MRRPTAPGAVLLALSLLCASGARAADPTRTVRVATEGRDAEGTRVVNRLEIAPDRTVKLDVSGTGGVCPSTGGYFEGSIGEEAARELHALAEKAAAEQKSEPREDEDGRGIHTLLTVETGGKVRSVPVRDKSRAWDALAAALLPVRQGLKPRSAVEFSVRGAKPGRVTAVFRHLGREPLLLILPEHADEGFRAEGAKLSYAGKAPAGEHELSPKKPELRVELKVSGTPKAPGRIVYTNSGYRHHAANDRMSGEPFPPDLTLCARPQ